jgi:uncharacterized protein YndB with AHSA1/START domain
MTDPQLIPEWWGDGTVVEEMDVRPGGTYRFRTPYTGVAAGDTDAFRALRLEAAPQVPGRHEGLEGGRTSGTRTRSG